jgi:hypothetical protein
MNKPDGYNAKINYKELLDKAISLNMEGKAKEARELLNGNGGIINVCLCKSYQEKANNTTINAGVAEYKEAIAYPEGME